MKSAGFLDFSDEIQQLRDAHCDYALGANHEALTTAASPQLRVCEQVLNLTKEQEARSREETWRLPGAGDVAIRTFFGQIASSVQKFVSVGDVLAQVDPIHVGLPWAGVRMILLVSIVETVSSWLLLGKGLMESLA